MFASPAAGYTCIGLSRLSRRHARFLSLGEARCRRHQATHQRQARVPVVSRELGELSGYEAMHMIRKGQVRWLLKGDVSGQVLFINLTLGLKAA